MIHRYLQDHLKCASNQLRQGKARYDKAGLRAGALIVGTTTHVYIVDNSIACVCYMSVFKQTGQL